MRKYIFLFILLFLPIVTYADSISLVCDKTDKININDEIVCRLSVNSSYVYNNINFNILNTEGIEVIDVRSNYEKRWTITRNNNIVSASSKNSQSDLQEFGIILIKAKKSGIQDLTIDNFNLENNEGEIKNVEGTNVSLKIISSDNLLKSILIDDNIIDNFDSNKTKYTIYINDKDSIKIDAISNNEFANIKGIGEFKLSSNINKFIYPIEVISEDNISKVYILELIRNNLNNSIVKDLDNLSIKNDKGNTLLINFKPSIYEYTIDVDINTKYLDITPTLSNKSLSLVKNYGIQRLELKSGNNIALIKVQDENGDILTYIINVIKPIANKSSNNYIKYLTISGYDLKFSKRVKNYTLEINPKDNYLDIKPVLESDKARYTIIGNSNLKTGSVIKIEVTAENEEKNIYKINIKEKSNNYSSTIFELLLIIIVGIFIYKYKNKLIELFTPVDYQNLANKTSKNSNNRKVSTKKKSSNKKVSNKKKTITKKDSKKSSNIKQSNKKKVSNSTSTKNPRNNYTKKNTTKKKSSKGNTSKRKTTNKKK